MDDRFFDGLFNGLALAGVFWGFVLLGLAWGFQ